MGQIDNDMLTILAARYLWWRTPEEAAEMPDRVIAQVMNVGDYDDVMAMTDMVGDDGLRNVLMHAEIGQFTPKSWVYWHYRLGLARLGEVPPLPVRRVS